MARQDVLSLPWMRVT